jgi:protein SCO1/2
MGPIMHAFIRRLIFSLLCLSAPLVAAETDLPSESIYNLNAALIDQSGKQHSLGAYRGHPVLITMFYGSCPAVCPLLIETLRSIESELDTSKKSQLRVLLISIDPERDTPAALLRLAKERRIDLSRWKLSTADAATVRKIAAVLNIQYRKLPDGDYNHSSVVTLLTPLGEIEHFTAKLGAADPAMITALKVQ